MANQGTPSPRGLILIGTGVVLGSVAVVAGLYYAGPGGAEGSALRLDILKNVASGFVQLAVPVIHQAGGNDHERTAHLSSAGKLA